MSIEGKNAVLTAEQSKLLERKLDILRKSRELQVELAEMRTKLTAIDQDMLKSGFHIPVNACW